jgi:hypothetical protein
MSISKKIYIVLISALLLSSGSLYAQAGITVSGKIFNQTTRQPIDFATVAVPEAKIKTTSAEDGSYTIILPAPGKYTFIVTYQGLRSSKSEITIDKNIARDFYLSPLEVKGAEITITGDREIQKLSRYTMTSREIKDVPATFGDSISALTALPGVIRTGAFFGPLVIRGADPNSNKYYIDSIPVFNPQHFTGIHSVISNDLMSEIDLYASSFPAQFGGANAAIININTVDEVKQFSGTAEVGLISSNIYLQFPLTAEDPSGEKEPVNKGYIITAGRYGYLSLFVPPVYELITGDKVPSVPEYYDYQFKAKYFLNSNNAFTILFMGSKDYIKFINDTTQPDEVDPLLEEFQFKNDLTSNSAGFYYTYQPSSTLKNTMLVYASLNDSYNYIDIEGGAPWVKGLNLMSKPYIYGIKDNFKFEWIKGQSELRAGAEANYYDFQTEGFTLIQNEPVLSIPDFADPDLFTMVPFNKTFANKALGSYIENKFTYEGLTVTPGVRMDYLDRSKTLTVDPRGLISYEFPTETTISAAAGQYSYFLQNNPFVFNLSPNLALQGKELKPERSIHRSVGFEQKISLYTLKIEAFQNNFFDMYEPISDSSSTGDLPGYCSGTQKVYGFETMLRLDRKENSNGPYGWINYAYTQSKKKSGLPLTLDPFGNTYLNFNREQEHSLKIVAGYLHNRHTFSARFQLYSSFPYTPIGWSDESPDGSGRYVRLFIDQNGNPIKPYSKHFDPAHRLDLRYSNKTSYKWGFVNWFVEVINVYNYQPVDREVWNYRKPYGTDNPTKESSEGLSLIPNIGVEVKF